MDFNNKLTIIVPTYNHSDYMDFYLSKMKIIDDINVILEIHDSSVDGKTQQVVERYQKTIKNLKYYKYEDIDVDVKTVVALQNCSTEYVFLCGDGVILNLEKTGKVILDAIQEGFDIIELYDETTPKHYNYYRSLSEKYSDDKIVYEEIIKHFMDNVWHMPYYGGSIVKSKVFKYAKLEQMEAVIGLGFVYPYMIYNYPYKNFKAVVLGSDFHIRNPYKKMAIWASTQKSAIKIWAHNFPTTINNLAEQYNTYKLSTIMYSEKILEYLTFRGLLYLRAIDNFNLKILKQYKHEMKTYATCGSFMQTVIAITPKFVLKVLKHIKNIIRRQK